MASRFLFDSCTRRIGETPKSENSAESLEILEAKYLGYGLTTAEIHYHMPDHPRLLQMFLWQEYDVAPAFPGLKSFLEFWQRELEGALHSVRVAHNLLIKPCEWKAVDGIFRLH